MKVKRVKKTYKQLARVGKEVYNDDGFCGVVAVAAAAHVSFGKAKALVESDPVEPRMHGKGTPMQTICRTLKALGHEVTQLDDPKQTIGTFKDSNPEGTFLILTGGGNHVLTLRDGIIMDWVKDNPKKRIKHVWRVV